MGYDVSEEVLGPPEGGDGPRPPRGLWSEELGTILDNLTSSVRSRTTTSDGETQEVHELEQQQLEPPPPSHNETPQQTGESGSSGPGEVWDGQDGPDFIARPTLVAFSSTAKAPHGNSTEVAELDEGISKQR